MGFQSAKVVSFRCGTTFSAAANRLICQSTKLSIVYKFVHLTTRAIVCGSSSALAQTPLFSIIRFVHFVTVSSMLNSFFEFHFFLSLSGNTNAARHYRKQQSWY